MSLRTYWIGAGLVTLASLIWTGNFLLARALNHNIAPISFSFLRWTVAVLVMLPFYGKKLYLHQDVIRKNWKHFLLNGFIGVAVFNTLLYYAGKSTTVANMSIISNICPIFIFILSYILLKEKLSKMKIIGILVTIFGVLILISDGSIDFFTHYRFNPGDIFMILSAVCFACYTFLIKKKPQALSNYTYLFILFCFGWAILLPFYIIEHFFIQSMEYNSNLLLSIIYLGIFASIIAFECWNQAIRKIGANNTAILYFLLPIYASVLGYLFLDELIGKVEIMSMTIIFIGLFITQKKFSNHKKKIKLPEK